MKHVVFISGSANGANQFDDKFRKQIRIFAEKGYAFVVGDCKGVDSMAQEYLAELGVNDVTVYFSACDYVTNDPVEARERYCRHINARADELGWTAKPVWAENQPHGRAFYTEKDTAMLQDADTLLICWDGKSKGSKRNLDEGRRLYKNVAVYLPNGTWRIIKGIKCLEGIVAAKGGIEKYLDDYFREIGDEDAVHMMASNLAFAACPENPEQAKAYIDEKLRPKEWDHEAFLRSLFK